VVVVVDVDEDDSCDRSGRHKRDPSYLSAGMAGGRCSRFLAALGTGRSA
jgi:hypothetical protein